MDGPESDSVWIAYQMEPENDSDEDEEEIEARLMEAEIWYAEVNNFYSISSLIIYFFRA